MLAVALAAPKGMAHAPGEGIGAAAIAHDGDALIGILALAFPVLLAGDAPPREWNFGSTSWIYKKGDKLDWLTYRGVVLVAQLSKLYERAILNRLATWIEVTRPLSGL